MSYIYHLWPFTLFVSVYSVCARESVLRGVPPWDHAATMMMATYLERHTWHSVLHCGHPESSHSFVGVCMLAFKHNSSRSERKANLGIPTHTQSSVLEAETNHECKKLSFKLRGTLKALKVSGFFLQTGSTICDLVMRTAKTNNLVLTRKQGERRWKATAVLCVVMGYHLSHGRERSPAAVAYTELTQLWMRRSRASAGTHRQVSWEWLAFLLLRRRSVHETQRCPTSLEVKLTVCNSFG